MVTDHDMRMYALDLFEENQMYKVFYTNHDYFAQDTFATVGAAVEYGKSKGFEFQVHDKADNMVASWRQFGGLRYHSGQDEESIPGPDTTISQGIKLPARVIAWAKQHDWFHSSMPDGVLIVWDRYTTRDGQYHEHVCVWNDTAQGLASWAGY